MTRDHDAAQRGTVRPAHASIGKRALLRGVGAILAIGAIAACQPASMPVTGERAQAQEIAQQLVAARDPVIDPGPVARCAAIHATSEQADALIAASRAGDRGAAQAALEVMLRKTSVQECLAQAGQPDFL
jgi:hypothetical protein